MTTLSSAVASYLVQLEADGRSAHTRAQVARHARLLSRWLAEHGVPDDVSALTPDLLARFLASPAARLTRDGSPKRTSSVNALRTSIRCLGRHLHDAGMLATNPARLVRRAHCSPPPPKPLSAIEIERLLSAMAAGKGEAARRDHALFAVMLGTGVRVSTAVSIRVEDIDLDAGVLNVTTAKGNARGRLFIPRALIGPLRDHLGERVSGPLFCAAHGGALSTRTIAFRLSLWAKRAGIAGKVSPHRLRHTFGTLLLARTGDLALTQRAMLHRSIASTTCYTLVSDDRLRAAVGG